MRKKVTESSDTAERLRQTGLRPTRQRHELADLLFRNGNHHLTAEELHVQALAAGIKVSLATVYNTLHQFTEAGLLRQVVVNATRSYFDTNMEEHHHYYDEDENVLMDVPEGAIKIENYFVAPPGTAIRNVEVVVRVKHI